MKGGDLQTTTVARQEFRTLLNPFCVCLSLTHALLALVPLERRASSRRVSISPPRDHYGLSSPLADISFVSECLPSDCPSITVKKLESHRAT